MVVGSARLPCYLYVYILFQVLYQVTDIKENWYVRMSLEMINHAPLILYNEEQGHSEQDLVRQEQHKYNLRLGSELIYGSKH